MPKEPLFQLEVDNFALYFDQVDKKCPLEVSCQFETQKFVNLKYTQILKGLLLRLAWQTRGLTLHPPALQTTFGSDWLTRENIGAGT